MSGNSPLDQDGDEREASRDDLQAAYEKMRDLCREANDGWSAERRRLWQVESCLRDLVERISHTGLHNCMEAAAARKVLRHEGWTKAGDRWLEAGAPTTTPEASA